MRRSILSASVLTLALSGCQSPTPPEPETPAPLSPLEAPAEVEATPTPATPEDRIAAALAGDHRSEEHRARDRWRNPAQTLAFFGLRPDATVVEITPGAGWYTEVLAPVLRNEGRLIAAVVDPATAASDGARNYHTQANERLGAKLAELPDLYGSVTIAAFDSASPRFADDESVDLVVTFRNVHNWIGSGAAPAMFEGFFKALKPGGVLGVVEHRAQSGSPADHPRSGYMTEQAVIDLATAAGFELAERSEINANPADTGDHPNGVWTLPPTLNVPEGEDPETYRAIGESDRMTLKFSKPRGDSIRRVDLEATD